MARRHLLLTGAPGVGKSTVVRKVAEALARDGVAIGGFRTGEIRDGGRRVGFRVTTFDGREAVLAHIDLAGPQRVGRYGVDVAALDRIVAGALAPDGLHLVDEIGPMECFSPRFKEAVRRLLDSDSTVVATIHRSTSGFVGEVKRRPHVDLWEVTRANRDAMPARVLTWIRR